MKNLKKSIQILSLLTLTFGFAQITPEVHFKTVDQATPIEEVTYKYLLGDKVFLRETPSLKSKKLAVLNIGTKLVLREKTNDYEIINGIKSNWYRVNVGADEGWVWGGLIAQKTFGSQTYHNVKFVYGYASVTTNAHGILKNKHQLRAYKNGIELDRIVFDGYKAIPLHIENMGNKGLFNVEDIIAIDIPEGKTNVSTGKTYIFWNNGKFTHVASLKNYSNKNYSKSESFIFPSDMEGQKNSIVLKTHITTHNTNIENDAADKKEYITSFFKWDGYKLVKKEDPPIVPNINIASNLNI